MAVGADVNARVTDVTSRTARWGVQQLHERGGQSALFGAVAMGLAPRVQYLIDHGAEWPSWTTAACRARRRALGGPAAPTIDPPRGRQDTQTAIGQ